ncbi:MAG: hypothetical protein JST86_09755 [Bacteroidetes bacterium]|nr:hypothetical protein [Bacteroidota bacterium]
MMRKKWISSLIGCFLYLMAAAQTAGYRFYAPFDTIRASGFYNILLTPEIKSYLKTDFSDVRIVNDTGRWIPHVLYHPKIEPSIEYTINPLRFTIEENSTQRSTIVAENFKPMINNLGLVIRNTVAERYCQLSGSDDKIKWFTISDSITMQKDSYIDSSISLYRINFPNSRYNYFRILINNKNKDPYNFEGVVQTDTLLAGNHNMAKEIPNPGCSISQKDSGDISFIKITQQRPYHIDQLRLVCNGVKYFSRRVEVYIPVDSNHSYSNPGQLVHTFTDDSYYNNNIVSIPVFNAPVFYLYIYNEDNPPLKVDSVITASAYNFITAYIEKGNNFRLLLSNSAAASPKYDLAVNMKKDSLPFIATGKIYPLTESPAKATTSGENKKFILWSAIIAVLFLLLLFTQKMLKEVNKQKHDDHL